MPRRAASGSVTRGASLASLHTQLEGARDPQVRRLVEMLDRLPERGHLDALLAPLRPRLARLRPDRPLAISRLLFLPLDAVIVPADRWRPGAPAIPRHALQPLLELVRAACPTVCQDVDRMIAGHWLSESTMVTQAGAHLWPAAAQVLLRAEMPPRSHAHGRLELPAPVFRNLARDVGAVLAQALPLQALVTEAAMGLELRLEGLLEIVAQLHNTRPYAIGMMMVLLHARLPEAIEPLLAAEAEIEPGAEADTRPLARAAAVARDTLIERLSAEGGAEAVIGRTMLDELAERIRQAGRLLQLLGSGASMDERHRLAQVEHRLLTGCLRRFEAALGAEFLRPLAALPTEASDAEVERLEASARALRNAREEVRLLGGGAEYDALLRRAIEQVKAMRVETSAARADRARLTEILVGPEEAWAMLQGMVDAR